MIKDVLQSIVGVDIYPVISLVIFLVAFTAITLWTILQDKTTIQKMSHLPLESTDSDRPHKRGA